MLVGEWATILRMAAQTELITIRRTQIVAGRASVGVMAICATHLPFPQRMVVRQAHLAALGLVTAQASIIRLPARLHDHFGLRDQTLHCSFTTGSRHVYESLGLGSNVGSSFGPGFGAVVVSLMAINATDLVGSMPAGQPVADFRIPYMTTQTRTIGIVGGTLTEGNDLGDISAAFHMQAAGTMALLTLNSLLRMEGVPELFGDVGVTRGARFRPHGCSSGNLNVLRERGNPVFGFLGRRGRKTKNDG